MSMMFWSKWIWRDILADHRLRRCSFAARGFWLELQALSVRSEPVGYLADGDKPLGEAEIARILGARIPQASRLLAELERNEVFSRDAQNRIYCRRIVRENAERLRNKTNGMRGGNPRLSAKGACAPDNPSPPPVIRDISQTAQQPTAAVTPPPPAAPLLRAVEVMGTTLDALHRKPAWLVFGDTFEGWAQDGCDPDRDIWPTIASLTAKRGSPPQSPLYFAEAVREARDRRLAALAPHTIGAPALHACAAVHPIGAMAHGPAGATPQLWTDRLAVFAAAGVWSRAWGPKPGDPGCLAPVETGDGPQKDCAQ